MLTRSSAVNSESTSPIDIAVVGKPEAYRSSPKAAQPRRNVHPINPPSARSGSTLLTTIDLSAFKLPAAALK